MKWFIAACVVLLALAAVAIRWMVDDEPEGTPLAAVTESRAGLNIDDIPASQRERESSSIVNSLSKTNTQTNGTNASAPSTAASDVRPAPRNGCARKESGKVASAPFVEAGVEDRDKDLANISHPTLNKEACYTTANRLKKAWVIFDVTATQAVWYSTVRPMAGSGIQNALLPRMCSGEVPFDATSQIKFELVAINAKSIAKILLGEYWVSDGTILSPLTELEYVRLTQMLVGRERQGVGNGRNMSRNRFYMDLEDHVFNRMAAAEELRTERDDELRRAQHKLLTDCVE